MSKEFSIMLPYRVTNMSNTEYADYMRALVRYIRSIGIKVFDLKETNILDENDSPIEHVYILECAGEPSVLSNVFSHQCVGHYGEIVLYN